MSSNLGGAREHIPRNTDARYFGLRAKLQGFDR